ncbi:hypothetical protein XM53_03650 [Roseovarius atlanticus]|uniref:Uncharacterized protein n=1 Tax=Roseovarius atlanticus TaxID=1641875 RepID=A0A0T5NXP4_9RHOB|nr:hypothetical protein XM53_03650 [Roseovarius atlanticus]
MIRRAICAALLLVSSALAGGAQPIPDQQAQLFVEFARDVSGNDPQVMATARDLIETPPTTLETIGYYGLEDAPAAERTLRGIISLLDAHGHILGFEDKYINEMPLVLEQHGLADFAGDPQKDIMSLFPGEIDPETGPSDTQWRAFRKGFGGHVRAIEAAMARKGHVLLSLDLPLGDTLHLWCASTAMAEKWRGQVLYFGRNTLDRRYFSTVTVAVTDAAWDDYWGFLTYALFIPERYSDLPDYE